MLAFLGGCRLFGGRIVGDSFAATTVPGIAGRVRDLSDV